MGSQVVASCPCGVEETILIGGGMLDFTTDCRFPCFCENCRRVVQANLLAKPLRCPECRRTTLIPYDDPRLSGTPGTTIVAQWNMTDSLGRELVLTDGDYRCPACGGMSLHFQDSGVCFD